MGKLLLDVSQIGCGLIMLPSFINTLYERRFSFPHNFIPWNSCLAGLLCFLQLDQNWALVRSIRRDMLDGHIRVEVRPSRAAHSSIKPHSDILSPNLFVIIGLGRTFKPQVMQVAKL
jgi:hypothetical protein